MKKFQVGDVVRFRKGKTTWTVNYVNTVGEFYNLVSKTGKYSSNQIHASQLELVKKVQVFQDKPDTESYEIDWSKLDPEATHHCFEDNGIGFCIIGPCKTELINCTSGKWYHNQSKDGIIWGKSPFALPQGADWRKSLRVNPNLIKSEPTPTVQSETKPDRSELYKLLPRVSEWGENDVSCAVDSNGDAITYTGIPFLKGYFWWSPEGYNASTSRKITLPPSISWRDTLVSREEMEQWEKSQGPTEDELNMPVQDYYMKKLNESDPESYEIDWSKLDPKATHHVFNADGIGRTLVGGNQSTTFGYDTFGWICNGDGDWIYPASPITLPQGSDWKKSLRVNPNLIKSEPTPTIQPETPQAKVERLKLELKEAEKELEKMKPIELSKVDGYSVDSVFVGYGQNIVPDGMVGKCLMFNRHKYKMEVLEHNEHTVLTFFKL